MEWAQSWIPGRHKQQRLLSDSRASPSHGYCSQCALSTSIYWLSPSLWAALCLTQVSSLPEATDASNHPTVKCHGRGTPLGDVCEWKLRVSRRCSALHCGPLSAASFSAVRTTLLFSAVRWPCRLFKFLMHCEPMCLIYLHKHVTFYIIKLKSIQIQSEVPFQLFLKATFIHDRSFYWVTTQILILSCHYPRRSRNKSIPNKLNYSRVEEKDVIWNIGNKNYLMQLRVISL